MTDLPALDEALRLLRALLPDEIDLQPSTRVVDAGLDSLAVLEWMFELGVDPEAVFVADSRNRGYLEDHARTLADLYDLFGRAVRTT